MNNNTIIYTCLSFASLSAITTVKLPAMPYRPKV